MALPFTSSVSPDPRIAALTVTPITNPDASARFLLWDITGSKWAVVTTPNMAAAIGAGAGTVTAVSVASANGFDGNSSGGATPALTISTTITGLLSGNGTAISAASTTGSGAVVLATAPTFATSIRLPNAAPVILQDTLAGDFNAVVMDAGNNFLVRNSSPYGNAYLGVTNGSGYVYIQTAGTNQLIIDPAGVVQLAAYTTNGFVKFTGSNGTLAVDTGSYPRRIFQHYADVGNVGTGEDDLYSDTLAAGQLAADGDSVEFWYHGLFNGAALSTQELRARFAGTLIYDSGSLTIGAAATDNWTMVVRIVRESSSVVRCSVSLSTDFATLFPYSTYTRITGLTLSNTNILKTTGEAAGAGAASDQIVAKESAGYYGKAA